MNINKNSWHFKYLDKKIKEYNSKVLNRCNYWETPKYKSIPNDFHQYSKEIVNVTLTEGVKASLWALLGLVLIIGSLPKEFLLDLAFIGIVPIVVFLIPMGLNYHHNRIKPRIDQIKNRFKIKLNFY